MDAGPSSTTSVDARIGSGIGRGSSLVRRLHGYNELGVLFALLTLVAVIGVMHPTFLRVPSLANVGQQAALYGIMALGMVFLLAMRELDLSVGGMYALTGITTAVLIRDGLDPWLGAVFCVAFGVALGAANGAVANLLKLPMIIVTIGTLTMYRGLGLVASGSSTVGGQPYDHGFYTVLGGTYLEVPAIVWVFVVLTILLTMVFRSTTYGFAVRAIGSNEEAARLSGYPIARIRLFTAMLVGGLSGISALMTLAFFAAADPNVGSGYELAVIAAAVIGGTGLSGGSGTVPGALMGALIISVIGAGLIQFGVSADWSIFVTGAVIVGAISLDALVRRRRALGG